MVKTLYLCSRFNKTNDKMAQIFKTKQLLLLIGFLMATTTPVWADNDENYEFVETFEGASFQLSDEINCSSGIWKWAESVNIRKDNIIKKECVELATKALGGSVTTPVLNNMPKHAKMTFKALGFYGGETIAITGTDCYISSTNLMTLPEFEWKTYTAYISLTGTSPTITFSCAANNSVRLTDIKIVYGATKINISNAKYATFCYDKALDFSSTSITAYTAKAESNKVVLTEIKDGIVPANTGVILYGDPVENEQIPFTTTDKQDVGTNEMVGINTEALIYQTDGEYTNYILSNGTEGVGFYLAAVDGAMLRANRAYLHTTAPPTSRALTFEHDDTTTGISATQNEHITYNNKVYNLSGQRVNHPAKGLYIIRSAEGGLQSKNGKKVIIK